MGRPLVSLGCSLLAVCLVVVSPAGTVLVGGHGPPTVPVADRPVLQQGTGTPDDGVTPSPADPDSVHLDVTVRENGTAHWQIEYRTRLEDPATTAAFRQLQRDLQRGSGATTDAFFDRIRATITSAENATGREMAGRDFSARADVRRLPQAYGVVTYSFEWQGFATVSDDRITAGDALAGFFLNEDERLLVSWPDGYELADVRPAPDAQRDGTVVWTGPTTFGPDEPRVVATEATSPLLPSTALVAALVLLGVAGAFAWLRRRNVSVPRPTVAPSDDGSGADLRSNEEQLVDLLEEHGGRVKQQEVAEELGWTRTKTSYVVTDLREAGRIHSFRLGRENVLSLSEPDEPAGGAAESG